MAKSKGIKILTSTVDTTNCSIEETALSLRGEIEARQSDAQQAGYLVTNLQVVPLNVVYTLPDFETSHRDHRYQEQGFMLIFSMIKEG